MNSFIIQNCVKCSFAQFCFLTAPAAKFLKRHISSASEKAFPVFFGDFFVADLPQKKELF